MLITKRHFDGIQVFIPFLMIWAVVSYIIIDAVIKFEQPIFAEPTRMVALTGFLLSALVARVVRRNDLTIGALLLALYTAITKIFPASDAPFIITAQIIPLFILCVYAYLMARLHYMSSYFGFRKGALETVAILLVMSFLYLFVRFVFSYEVLNVERCPSQSL